MSETFMIKAGKNIVQNRPPVSRKMQEESVSHLFKLYPSMWVACQFPERPIDLNVTCIHDCCPACLLAVKAHHNVSEVILVNEQTGRPVLELLEARLDEWGECPADGC